MYFCTWKDEDGRHYGVTNVNPKRYFSWPGCHLCDPKTVKVDSEEAYYLLDLTVENLCELLDGKFVEIELDGMDSWEWYLDVRKNMRYLY